MELAIIILNWNGKEFLDQFLPGVIANSPSAEVAVADNGSTDDSLEYLKEHYPSIRVIDLKENYGFAGGYNKALAQLDSEFFLLLNSDIQVTEGWLDPMLEMIRSSDKIAAVQPKILSYNNKRVFEHAGAAGGFIDKDGYPFCRGRIFDVFEEDQGQYDDEHEIFWATGACLLIRSSAFEESGGFNDRFFAHMEEIDLCWRLKNAGYKIMYTPNSAVYHVGGGALPYDNPRKTFLNFRNSLFMITRNYHDSPLLFMILKRLILDGVAGVKFLLEGNAKHTWQIIRAHYQFFGKLGVLLKERKAMNYNPILANKKGVYKRSIVKARYLRGEKMFSELDPSEFY